MQNFVLWDKFQSSKKFSLMLNISFLLSWCWMGKVFIWTMKCWLHWTRWNREILGLEWVIWTWSYFSGKPLQKKSKTKQNKKTTKETKLHLQGHFTVRLDSHYWYSIEAEKTEYEHIFHLNPCSWLLNINQSGHSENSKLPVLFSAIPGNILPQPAYVLSYSQLQGIHQVSSSFVGNPNALSVTKVTQKNGQKTLKRRNTNQQWKFRWCSNPLSIQNMQINSLPPTYFKNKNSVGDTVWVSCSGFSGHLPAFPNYQSGCPHGQ